MNQKQALNPSRKADFLSSFQASLPSWAASLCGITGAALLLAGTGCFVAYNWNVLGVLGKFALPLVGLAACAVSAYIQGLDTGAGKVLTFACGLFIGLFWAVYGQVFQTGSFVYEFCFAWALCLLPIACLAKNRWLWLLWAAVCNLYLLSFMDVWLKSANSWGLLAFNAVCFAVSERVAFLHRKGGWFSLFFLAGALLAGIMGGIGGWNMLFWINAGIICLLGLYAWRFKRGGVQLGFCAFALDILLAERILSAWDSGLVTVVALLLLFVLSAAGVYYLIQQEKTHER